LKQSQKKNRSCGLLDIPIYEEFLMILVKQRQKLWISVSQSAFKKRAIDAAAKNQHTEEIGNGTVVDIAAVCAPTDLVCEESISDVSTTPFVSLIVQVTGIVNETELAENSSTAQIDSQPVVTESELPSSASNSLTALNYIMDMMNSENSTSEEEENKIRSKSNEGDDSYEFPEFVPESECQGEGEVEEVNRNSFLVDSLENMGFPRKWCEIALDMCGDDPEEALNYIMNNGISLEEALALDRADSEGGGGDSGGERS